MKTSSVSDSNAHPAEDSEPAIEQYIPSKPGNIVDMATGKVVGHHDGLWQFTIGQRARIMSMSEKAFVAHKDVEKNEIQVVLGT